MDIKDNHYQEFLDEKKKKNIKAFDVSLQTRNFEIELFWKRSNFFWLFIAAAFTAFALLSKEKSNYALIISCLGFVCSMAWTLANRGSKYWQENWEQKVEQFENGATGSLFSVQEKIKDNKYWMYRARKYSVSKLIISLSDYITLLWFGIISYSILKKINIDNLKDTCIYIWLGFSSIYCIHMIRQTKKSNDPPDVNLISDGGIIYWLFKYLTLIYPFSITKKVFEKITNEINNMKTCLKDHCKKHD